MKRFWHTNKEYCQLIYEHTGLWPDRVAYASDDTEYYFYYQMSKHKQIEQHLEKLAGAVAYAEGARSQWNPQECCLRLYFDE